MNRANQNLLRWVAEETWCRRERTEGWYVDDCLKAAVPVTKRCLRCRRLAALTNALRAVVRQDEQEEVA